LFLISLEKFEGLFGLIDRLGEGEIIRKAGFLPLSMTLSLALSQRRLLK